MTSKAKTQSDREQKFRDNYQRGPALELVPCDTIPGECLTEVP